MAKGYQKSFRKKTSWTESKLLTQLSVSIDQTSNIRFLFQDKAILRRIITFFYNHNHRNMTVSQTENRVQSGLQIVNFFCRPIFDKSLLFQVFFLLSKKHDLN